MDGPQTFRRLPAFMLVLERLGVSATVLWTAITGFTAVAAVAFFAVVKWQPRAWWLLGWAAFTALTALFTFVYPVVVAPLFHNFTPLQDSELKSRVVSLAADAGIEVEDVLVADASRRTTAENAYVAGLGATKRIVVYDTLLEAGADEDVGFVVAHELGHQEALHARRHRVHPPQPRRVRERGVQPRGPVALVLPDGHDVAVPAPEPRPPGVARPRRVVHDRPQHSRPHGHQRVARISWPRGPRVRS